MTVSDSHDVLIVGGGPAGSTLGYLLAEKGFDVCVIDRAHFPRPKLCGGALTWKTRKLLEEMYKMPFAELFSTESASEDYVIYERYKQKVYQSSPEPFYFINRKKYDATLVSLAQGKGCQFQFGKQVTEIDFQSGGVYTRPGREFNDTNTSKKMDEIIANNKFNDRNKVRERNRFLGKIIVGADGVTSIVRTRLFPGMDFHRNSGLAFQITIPSGNIKFEYRAPLPRLFLGGVKCGYGWIFPHGEQFALGLWGLIKKDKNVKEKYLDFLQEITDIDTRNLSNLPSHLGPAGNFMEDPGDANVLLVGDAAGFADPLTGEGIYYGHKSAECAANAICDFFGSGGKSVLLESYKSYLNPTLKELKISLRFRNLFYSHLRHLAYFFLRDPRLYFKLAAVIHGTKSYSRLPIISRLR
jgi:geranylgeranyl reductase family protein